MKATQLYLIYNLLIAQIGCYIYLVLAPLHYGCRLRQIPIQYRFSTNFRSSQKTALKSGKKHSSGNTQLYNPQTLLYLRLRMIICIIIVLLYVAQIIFAIVSDFLIETGSTTLQRCQFEADQGFYSLLYLLGIVSWILSMAVSGAEYMRGMHILVTVNGLFWIVQCVLYIIVAVLDGITFHEHGCISNMNSYIPLIFVTLQAFFSLVLTILLPWKSSISYSDKNSIINVIAQGRTGQETFRYSTDSPSEITNQSSKKEDRVIYSEIFKLRTGISSLLIKMPGDFRKRPRGFTFRVDDIKEERKQTTLAANRFESTARHQEHELLSPSELNRNQDHQNSSTMSKFEITEPENASEPKYSTTLQGQAGEQGQSNRSNQMELFRNVSEARPSSYRVGIRDRQTRGSPRKKQNYSVNDLKLFFLIELIVNNGQQKISIERSLDDFINLDVLMHKVINLQTFPASVVAKLPDLTDVSNSISAMRWNQVLQRYLRTLIKREEFFIPQLFKFLGLAFGLITREQKQQQEQETKQSSQPKSRPSARPSVRPPSRPSVRPPSRPSAIATKRRSRDQFNIVSPRFGGRKVSHLMVDTQSERAPPHRSLSVFTAQTRTFSRNDSKQFRSPQRKKHGRTFGESDGLRLIEAVNIKAVGYDQESLTMVGGPFFHFKLQENIYAKSWNIHKRINDFKQLRRDLAESLGKREREVPALSRILRNDELLQKIFISGNQNEITALMARLESYLVELMSHTEYCREPLFVFLDYDQRKSLVNSNENL